VDVKRFSPYGKAGDFYLVVSRLNPYKRIDLAVEAFNTLGLPLKIIGDGPFADKLKAMAGPNIEFLGYLDDSVQAEYYAGCRALVFPGTEDFGIVPLEANAAGRPVIAFKAGGALDTVVDGVTGVFFEERSAISLAGAVKRVEGAAFDSEKIRAHSLKFSKQIFIDELKGFISRVYEEGALKGRPEGSAAGGAGAAGRGGRG
jgi:glycosyltransferase involved in cell wall biosynthesis